jgi:peptidoglycan/LPS O-acetylase OafA/YrhL
MYIVHPFARKFVEARVLRLGPEPPPFLAGVTDLGCSIALTLLIAYVSYVGYEQHFLHLKRYFDPFRGAVVPLGSSSPPPTAQVNTRE